MPRHAVAVAVALCACHSAVAAPAPPARLVAAEAVLKPPRGTPRELAAKLLSAAFVNNVARSQAARTLNCVCGEKDPVGWLSARLRATVDEVRGTVTLTLAGCPRRDAVALLSAAVAAYKADLTGQGRVNLNGQLEQAVLIQALIAAQPNAGGQMPVNITFDTSFSLEIAGHSTAEVDKSVIQAPKILQPEVPRKPAPAR